MEALKRHKAQQNALRLQLGGAYNSEDLVFPDPLTGEAWGPDRFSAAFYYQAHKAGIDVSFHGLRHSFATIAQRAGASLKDTSEFLGHSAIGSRQICTATFLRMRSAPSPKRVGDAIFAEKRRILGA